jgi:uncharacterized protein (TIGR02118 family)
MGGSMYKVIWLVRFRKDRKREDVLRWWREDHGKLAAATPGMIRYVQSHWTAALHPDTSLESDVATPFYDGHAEHWFASKESYEAAMASEEWQATVIDGPEYFDGITRIGGALEEYVVSWDSSSDGRVYPEARAAAP